jgi:hypothetical protein
MIEPVREFRCRLGDAQEQLNQTAARHARPRDQAGDAHGRRGSDASFSNMPAPDRRRLGGPPWIDSGSAGNPDSAVDRGKKSDSAVFCENPSRKHALIQVFAA